MRKSNPESVRAVCLSQDVRSRIRDIKVNAQTLQRMNVNNSAMDASRRVAIVDLIFDTIRDISHREQTRTISDDNEDAKLNELLTFIANDTPQVGVSPPPQVDADESDDDWELTMID